MSTIARRLKSFPQRSADISAVGRHVHMHPIRMKNSQTTQGVNRSRLPVPARIILVIACVCFSARAAQPSAEPESNVPRHWDGFSKEMKAPKIAQDGPLKEPDIFGVDATPLFWHVRQGVGDCYLMATLSAIAVQHPKIIKDMIKPVPAKQLEYLRTTNNVDHNWIGESGTYPNKTHMWSVSLRVDGRTVPVVVDEWLPVWAVRLVETKIFGLREKLPLWPFLIEKAIAKCIANSPDYKHLCGGTSIEAITWLTPYPTECNIGTKVNWSQSQEYLRSSFKQNKILLCDFKKHAYAITNIKDNTITLWNPHGNKIRKTFESLAVEDATFTIGHYTQDSGITVIPYSWDAGNRGCLLPEDAEKVLNRRRRRKQRQRRKGRKIIKKRKRRKKRQPRKYRQIRKNRQRRKKLQHRKTISVSESRPGCYKLTVSEDTEVRIAVRQLNERVYSKEKTLNLLLLSIKGPALAKIHKHILRYITFVDDGKPLHLKKGSIYKLQLQQERNPLPVDIVIYHTPAAGKEDLAAREENGEFCCMMTL